MSHSFIESINVDVKISDLDQKINPSSCQNSKSDSNPVSEQTSKYEYMSINGHRVTGSSGSRSYIVRYPLDLMDQFICPITQNVFKYPVYLCASGSIYDRDSIIKWLSESNVDPLSGIVVPEGKIQYIPVLNFFLASLCLEKTDSELIYHPPHGDILTLLTFASYLCSRHQIKPEVFEKDSLINISTYAKSNNDSVINLDFDDYCSKSLIPYTNKKSSQLKAITLEEILCICPITKRSMRQNTMLSKQGMVVHKKVAEIQPLEISREMTLSGFHKLFECSGTKNVVKCDGIFNVLQSSGDSLNDSLNDFEIVYDPDSIRSVDHLMDYNLITEHRIIDILNTRYEPYFNDSGLFRIFIKTQGNQYFDIHIDPFLECTSTHQIIYQKFKKFNPLDSLNAKKLVKLNQYVNNNKVRIFDTWTLTGSEDGILESHGFSLLKMRHRLCFDTYASEDSLYGGDLSYLTLSNCSYKNKIFKSHYFVGTQFNNVIFTDCHFEWCIFIGVDVSDKSTLRFNKCHFSDSSFYGSMIDDKCITDCHFHGKSKQYIKKNM